MTAQGATKFEASTGLNKFLHYMVFPIDIFYTGDTYDVADKEQRFCELTPILCWLIPLTLILTTFTYLSGLGLGLYILIQTILLVVISLFYCWRISLNFIFSLFINYLFSFILLYILLNFISLIFASCGIVFIAFFAFAIIIFFGRGTGSYYTYDDW